MTTWGNVKIASAYDDTPDAESASDEELSHITQTGAIPQAERYNPNKPYFTDQTVLDTKDEILLQAIKQAISRGWEGWRSRINDAVTVGLEAEQLVKEMKAYKTDVKTLLYDHDFAKALWGELYELKLKDMVVARDIMEYVKENL